MSIPLVYLCIYQRLKEATKGKEIDRKKALEIIRRIYHLQKKYAVVTLKELEKYGLIKVLGWNKNGRIEILKTKIDIEDTSKLYRSIGFY